MMIWFDMDGTIADLYGVREWLPRLLNSDATPYAEARPLVNLQRLARRLNRLQREGYQIGIISWLCRGGSAEYGEAVAEAKREWLRNHLASVQWNEINIVEYGVAKENFRSENDILFDDEIQNRENWGCGAYEPNQMFEVLGSL